MPSEKQKIIVMMVLLTGFLCYTFSLYTFLPVKNYPESVESAAGKLVWQQYNCTACHQIYGLGGYLGPDLTNEYSRRDTNYIVAFLKNGTTTMPKFKLGDHEINALIAFLKVTDKSGRSDPRTFIIKNNGTIQQ